MQPRTKLALVVLAATGVWVAGSIIVVSSLFLSAVSDMAPNTGSLGAFLVALLSGIAVVVLNELGFFAQWSRTRVRFWALTTSLTVIAVIAVAHHSSPAVRSIVHRVFEL